MPDYLLLIEAGHFPLSVGTFGRWGEEAVDFLRDAAHARAIDVGASALVVLELGSVASVLEGQEGHAAVGLGSRPQHLQALRPPLGGSCLGGSWHEAVRLLAARFQHWVTVPGMRR